MNINDARLKKAIHRNVKKITSSSIFTVLFNERMIEEVIPLIQMGIAIYLDKPIYLLVRESERALIPENLRRLAKEIEYWDDSLPEDLELSALQAATTRLMQSAEMRGDMVLGKDKDKS